MTRAAIYVRISQDRGGEGLGVARQEEDCRKVCAKEGWEVADVYIDNDVSAYSGKPRPAWKRLLRDIDDGLINAIAVWHVDRLTRTPIELEDVITLADVKQIKLATFTGEIDLRTVTGRMVARMLGAAARAEVEHKSERQRRQRRQSAEKGEPNMGGHRPFGYNPDRLTICEDEAELIREAARRVLSRESLASICRDFKDRGVVTTAGKNFRPAQLRVVLASARISGRREHSPGETTSSNTPRRRPLTSEIVADAQWPAIISPADSDRLRRIFTDPSRRLYAPGTGRKYLLSGVLRCGLCGHNMSGRPRGNVPRYVCPNTPGAPSCGKVATKAEPTDALVRDLVLHALSSKALAVRLRKRSDIDPALPKEIADDEEEINDLAAAYARKEIDRGEWQTMRGIVQARLERNRKALAQATATAPLLDMVGDYGDLLTRWEGLTVGQRRAIVSSVIEVVNVGSANPRKKWDPDRFDPVWRF